MNFYENTIKYQQFLVDSKVVFNIKFEPEIVRCKLHIIQ